MSEIDHGWINKIITTGINPIHISSLWRQNIDSRLSTLVSGFSFQKSFQNYKNNNNNSSERRNKKHTIVKCIQKSNRMEWMSERRIVTLNGPKYIKTECKTIIVCETVKQSHLVNKHQNDGTKRQKKKTTETRGSQRTGHSYGK